MKSFPIAKLLFDQFPGTGLVNGRQANSMGQLPSIGQSKERRDVMLIPGIDEGDRNFGLIFFGRHRPAGQRATRRQAHGHDE